MEYKCVDYDRVKETITRIRLVRVPHRNHMEYKCMDFSQYKTNINKNG
jgi:hypothetical protein